MNNSLTPVMQQYWGVKSLHPDKVVLFQMGDFFEMFYKDAETAAPILNIALTSRSKKDSIPMCGVPLHAMPKNVGKLLLAGYKVVICDQVSGASGRKGLVERKVSRILSPGMTYDPSFLDELKSHYLCAFDQSTVSFVDHTTGEAFTYSFSSLDERRRLILLIQPVEIIFDEQQKSQLPFSLENTHFSLHKDLSSTKAPDSVRRLESYIQTMGGKKALKNLRPFEKRYAEENLLISETAHKHLEILQTFEAQSKGSLFSAVNRTVTSSGARWLKQRLLSPLANQKAIEKRLDRVEYFVRRAEICHKVRELLKGVGDLERTVGKICSPSVNARDVLSLGRALEESLKLSDFDPCFKNMVQDSFTALEKLSSRIIKQIHPSAPLSLKEGGLFNRGVDEELDSLVDWSENSQKMILKMESEERQKTNIPSLKIRYNQIFGYSIEVTKVHIGKVPAHYFRKQTLTQAERYTTKELQSLEEKVLTSKSKRTSKEYEMFQEVLENIYACLPEVHRLARAVNDLDVSSSLAFTAMERNYTRPVFGKDLFLKDSRHPVIEQSRSFTPNTVEMKSGECLLLTGPNMAGKSTLMRQTALNVLLAQTGSYVSAGAMRLPVFKKIFTRIGSSDRLHSGLSTFMVEMKEAAEILNQADENSLIILDELGRGTSTYDGLSLAQAILEYLIHYNKSYIFFSTHYHELTHIQARKIQQGHMAVQAVKDDIEFLYTLRKGSCGRSYGIAVGEKAGLPVNVIARAKELIQGFEKNSTNPVQKELF